MLKIENLHKIYGKYHALSGLDMGLRLHLYGRMIIYENKKISIKKMDRGRRREFI